MTGIDYSETSQTYSVESQRAGVHKYDKYSDKPIIGSTAVSDNVGAHRSNSEERKQSKLTPLRLFLAFTFLAFLMTIWVWEAAYVRQGLMEIEKLKDQKADIEKTNEAIQVEITKLSNYDRISKIASEKLRMIPAKDKPGVIFMDADKAALIDKKNE